MVKKYFLALIFEWRKKRAVRKAQHDADLYRKKFLVIVFNGKPVVVSMQGLKSLIHKHRFARGFSAEKAAKLAIYTAFPSKK